MEYTQSGHKRVGSPIQLLRAPISRKLKTRTHQIASMDFMDWQDPHRRRRLISMVLPITPAGGML